MKYYKGSLKNKGGGMLEIGIQTDPSLQEKE